MTAIASAPTRSGGSHRARPIFYARAIIAISMMSTWAASLATGILVWQAADGRGVRDLPILLGAPKHAWADVHVLASFVALGLTLTHLTIMRNGAVAYLRLLARGRRRAVAEGHRQPRGVVVVRALLVTALLAVIPLVILTGIVPWLAADGQRTGQLVLLLSATKRTWADAHTAISFAVVAVALTHIVLARTGLRADLRLLATGQRSRQRITSQAEAS